MKKLTRKLFLSVAALAVCAATLVSTTFAWYVNNPTAYATGATGSTADVDTSGSLSISKTGGENTWFKTISLSDVTGELNPAHSTDGLAFTALETAAGEDGKIDSNVSSTDFITITLYLKADAAGTVDLDLTTVNTTDDSDYKSQVSYSETNAPKTKGLAFYLDAINAMYISRTVYTGASYTEAGQTAINTLRAESDTYTNETTVELSTGGNANAYYEEVKEETLADAAKAAPTTAAMAPISLVANTPVKVVYNIWLEGADIDCFNACTNQDFTFDFTYNYTKTA